MTERDLVHRAKVFKANCESNAEKMSFADSCKIVLLSAFIDGINPQELIDPEGDQMYIVRGDLMRIYRDLVDVKPWYRRFFK